MGLRQQLQQQWPNLPSHSLVNWSTVTLQEPDENLSRWFMGRHLQGNQQPPSPLLMSLVREKTAIRQNLLPWVLRTDISYYHRVKETICAFSTIVVLNWPSGYYCGALIYIKNKLIFKEVCINVKNRVFWFIYLHVSFSFLGNKVMKKRASLAIYWVLKHSLRSHE